MKYQILLALVLISFGAHAERAAIETIQAGSNKGQDPTEQRKDAIRKLYDKINEFAKSCPSGKVDLVDIEVIALGISDEERIDLKNEYYFNLDAPNGPHQLNLFGGVTYVSFLPRSGALRKLLLAVNTSGTGCASLGFAGTTCQVRVKCADTPKAE